MPESSARREAGPPQVSWGDCPVAVSAKLASLPELHDVPDEVVARSLKSCSLSLSAWPIAGMAAGSDATPGPRAPRRSVPPSAHVEADSSEPEATAAREPLQPIAPTLICLPRPVRLAEAEPCAVQPRCSRAILAPRTGSENAADVGTKILEVCVKSSIPAVMFGLSLLLEISFCTTNR